MKNYILYFWKEIIVQLKTQKIENVKLILKSQLRKLLRKQSDWKNFYQLKESKP